MRETKPAALWGKDQNKPQSSDVTLRGSSTLSLEGMTFRRWVSIYENRAAIRFGAGACGADVAYLIMVDNEANFLQCPIVSMDYIILVAILDIAEKDQISTNPFHVHNLQ